MAELAFALVIFAAIGGFVFVQVRNENRYGIRKEETVRVHSKRAGGGYYVRVEIEEVPLDILVTEKTYKSIDLSSMLIVEYVWNRATKNIEVLRYRELHERL